MAFISCVNTPLLHEYEYEPDPPDTLTSTLPSIPPLQSMSVTFPIIFIAVGCPIAITSNALQPSESVTETE